MGGSLARGGAGLVRGFAKKAAKADAKAAAPASKGAPKPGSSASNTVVGINFIKGGEDPPILPDSEYPAWLWGLTTEEAAYPEVRKRFDSGAPMSKEELRRFFTMRRRVEIKERNAEMAK